MWWLLSDVVVVIVNVDKYIICFCYLVFWFWEVDIFWPYFFGGFRRGGLLSSYLTYWVLRENYSFGPPILTLMHVKVQLFIYPVKMYNSLT